MDLYGPSPKVERMDITAEIEELKKILEPDSDSGRSIIDKDIPFFEVDLKGNFTSVPGMLEDITGFSNEELNLLSLQNVVFVEDRPKVIQMLDGIAGGSRMIISEIEIFSERLGSHPVELVILPKTEEGRTTGAWGALKDLEGRKDVEDQLEATREVQEASRQFLRDFVSLMAREIRQPMTTILLTLELLDSGFFGDINNDQKEKIDQLISLVDRLKGILQEALETSRDLGEELKLNRRILVMERVIEDAVESRRNDLSRKGITLNFNRPREKVKVPADRKMMFQVISSLLENSIDLSPQKGHIIIDLEKRDEELQFSIADSGDGIPEQEVESIFDKIHVDQEKEKGSFKEGLNLYMAKKVVQTHGGRIWCESFQGLGSTFLFTIPAKKEAEDGG